MTYGATLGELQGSLCALLLVLRCIVALLADRSASIFAFLRITADSCCLLSSLSLACTPFSLVACLYVTQTTALRPVLTLDPRFKVSPGAKVLPSSVNDVGSPSHQTSVPDVQSPVFFFFFQWSQPLNRCPQQNKLHLQLGIRQPQAWLGAFL